MTTRPPRTVAALRAASPLDFLELVVVSAIWGSSFLCIAIALQDLAPLEIAAWRLTGAALVIGAIVRWRGLAFPSDTRNRLLLIAVGVLNGAVPFTLIGWGQQSVASSTTGILLATSPFVTLLLSRFLTRDEGFGWEKWVGLGLGFAGIWVLFGVDATLGSDATGAGLPASDTSASDPRRAGAGMLAIIVAAACYALSAVLIRRLAGVPNLVVVAGMLGSAALVLLPFLLVLHPPWQSSVGVAPLAAVTFLALGPTAVAYVLRTRLVQRNGAVFMSGAGYLIPLFAVGWGWLFLGERPTVRVVFALLLVLSGIAVGQLRSYTRRSPSLLPRT